MKTLLLPLYLIVIVHVSKAQNDVDKYISKKNVTRIISTLAADDMMGRPAEYPALIENATAFIEKEFKKIGLKPLAGLKSYRQEFVKNKISPQSAELVVGNEPVAPGDFLLLTEKTEINITGGLLRITLPYDSAVQNKDQYFFTSAFRQMKDTTSSIIFIPEEFESSFREFKRIFATRFAKGLKSTKIFVLGKSDTPQYSIKAVQRVEHIKMTNVVGQLEGKAKPNEVVVFGAHYDHLGIQALEIEGDSIANGADDDASGTTAVIALARYFRKMKNNTRTLIFVAFTAEELGGFGSQYFSEQLDPGQVVAMLNIEMIGKPSKWGQNSAFITGYDRSNLGEILQNSLAGTPFSFKPDPYPEQNLFYRSDNATLARLGVPAHTISTDQIDTDQFYHRVTDEVETLDMENLTTTIKAVALSARSLVDGTETPTRIDKATVK